MFGRHGLFKNETRTYASWKERVKAGWDDRGGRVLPKRAQRTQRGVVKSEVEVPDSEAGGGKNRRREGRNAENNIS
jgi:hypothetical protein